MNTPTKATVKLINAGRSQTVRIPKEYRFDSDEVCITKIGEMVILFQADKGWDLLAKSLNHFTSDFMQQRVQVSNVDHNK
ncbi:MAG: AbrB/MazE/SpoVT family DNA-binding domain-containing protein [Phycisphaerales bacterium]|nr:AbrB/MazE/SpoVT family DNA-binding domain-containing protein [Phycisphaerales bacterium]